MTRVVKRGGVLLAAAFAVGRAESVLLALARIQASDRIPAVQVFLNSPMAIEASRIYQLHRDEHRLDAKDFTAM